MNAFKALAAAAILTCAAVAAVPAAAQDEGPSFSCAKARSWVERTICGDPGLSEKDLRMARAYRSFIDQYVEGGGEGTDTSQIRSEQRAWLRQRNQCRTRACLHRAYDARITDLEVDY